jgi:hypothetical protein
MFSTFILAWHALLCYNQFEDEFRRFLPAYMDMLQQVDSINDDEEVI